MILDLQEAETKCGFPLSVEWLPKGIRYFRQIPPPTAPNGKDLFKVMKCMDEFHDCTSGAVPPETVLAFESAPGDAEGLKTSSLRLNMGLRRNDQLIGQCNSIHRKCDELRHIRTDGGGRSGRLNLHVSYPESDSNTS